MREQEEQKVVFGLEAVPLEGLFSPSGSSTGAIITHPHPLMGGDMRNNVVQTVTKSFFAAGFSTLRFNFRGTGGSSGTFDGGRGEQEDVLSATSYLKLQGIMDVILAGYSFGAWVSAGVIRRGTFLPAVFLAPPITLFDFDFPSLRGKIGIIFCGGNDPYCPSGEITSIAKDLSCTLDIIPYADHFFFGHEEDLAMRIDTFGRLLIQKKTL